MTRPTRPTRATEVPSDLVEAVDPMDAADRSNREDRADRADLTIQEMARRSGFSEPTLRYYEKIGLLGTVGRDESSGHRRYGPSTVDRVEALSCLRSAGMTVGGMRRYLDLLARGNAAAAEQRDLFATQADKLAADIDQLRLRLAYLRGKADLWDSRVRGDADAEKRAIDEVTLVMDQFTVKDVTK